ncbi:MAG: hypothetical protein HY280_07060 [Nitrospinae bacterium]|nr:hypothetical protein [Nitrospinota bacterium]
MKTTIKGTLSNFYSALSDKINSLTALNASLILAAIFFLPALAVYNVTDAHGDIAEYLNDAFRAVGGEMPYRDFWLLLPPGKAFLPAMVLLVFGHSVNAVMISALVINVAVGITSYFLCLEATSSKRASFVSALLVFFNGSISLSYGLAYPHTWVLLVFLSAIFAVRYFKSASSSDILAAGLFAGSAFFFEFFLVGSYCFAVVSAILYHSRAKEGRFSPALVPLAMFFFSAVVVVSAELAAMRQIAFRALYTIVIDAPSHGTSLNLPYLKESLFSLESMIISYAPVLLVACFFRGLRGKLPSGPSAVLVFFFVWVLAAFPKALGRSDLNHVAQSVTPMYFFFAAYMAHFSLADQKAVGAYKYFPRILMAGVAILLVFDVEKFFEHSINNVFRQRQIVQTPRGRLEFTDLALAGEVNEIISAIEAKSKEGDYIFVAPWSLPPLYAMTNRKNPTYYDSMMDIEVRPALWKENSVCSSILEKNAKIAVLSAPEKSPMGASGARPMQIIEKCVEGNFSLVRRTEHFLIYAK